MAAPSRKLSRQAQARAVIEQRRRTRDRISGVDADAIPADASLLEWCESLAKPKYDEHGNLISEGMKIDGKPFSLKSRPALIPLYEAIPKHRHEAKDKVIVVQKATQIGATVWELLADTYMARKWTPVTIGMFLPDQASAAYKSEHRFMRTLRSVPALYKYLINKPETDGTSKKIGEGNVLTRVMGESLFLFLWTSGKVTTESKPMDVISLDEVQEMELVDIDKVMKRTGDSDVAFTLMLSTANMDKMDINFWYLLGTQEVWHTRCPHCGELSDLSDPEGIFPTKSITYNTGQYPGRALDEYYWSCPECGGVIDDPQIGEVVAKNPSAVGGLIRSFLLPRTISPKMTPRKMMEEWGRCKTGDQKKSFYNRTLARPYIDPEQLPVSMSHCLACVDEGMRVGITWESEADRDGMYYMGIDQMGGFHAIIIKKRLRDGRQATVHIEAAFAVPTQDDPEASPWQRSEALMHQYRIAVCVVEQLPNVDAARTFCNKFPGRAFMASYADLKDEMIIWGDALSNSDKKTAEGDRSRYTVTLSQYKCMQVALYRIRDKHCLFPDPDNLIQDVLDDGVWRRIPVARDWTFMHFTKTALIVDDDKETRKPRARVKKIGIDPHFSYANMLCDVAWARAHGTSTFIFPDPIVPSDKPKASGAVAPQAVRDLLEAGRVHDKSVCGRCISYFDGRCQERGLRVGLTDPGCDEFIAIDS